MSVLRTAGALALATALACSESTESTPEPAPAPGGGAPPAGAADRGYSEQREACADHDPLRRALWGELHVHSGLSMDAYMWDVHATPDEVYAFAKGEPARLAPLDDAGRGTREIQLERPLDFAALTDHASYIGEVSLCTRPGTPAYDTEGCRIYRGDQRVEDPGPYGDFGARISRITRSLTDDGEVPARHLELCGPGAAACTDAMGSVWQEIKAAAERHYDRSSGCGFTTFHAYEYTATPAGSKVHHNVLFRNAETTELPIAWVDEPDVYGLWKKLRDQCLEADGACDVLTLPHNSNLSNGRIFAVTGRDLPLAEQRERAALRARLEPLVEISQIKGDSECRDGMYQVLGGNDELCAYEEWRLPGTPDCEEGTAAGALFGQGCVSRLDYVRYALIEGLREQGRLGVNPYKLGIVAATDAHNGNPGDAEEYSWDGWQGIEDATPLDRLGAAGGISVQQNITANPGGMAGIWAEENSRDAIFDAMQRRETFGTSGPRLTARFFGGWDYPPDLCDDPDLVARGYASGVPMGGDLPTRPDGAAAPVFAVSALRDPGAPGHPGTPLQRVQIIKGWVDDEGRFHQAVHDVAGGPGNADVDLATCHPRGGGHDGLCAVWSDPDFDPGRRAVYYVRVLENPSCRWNQYQCNALPTGERPPVCSNPDVPKTIQERLWTAPIWYEPVG